MTAWGEKMLLSSQDLHCPGMACNWWYQEDCWEGGERSQCPLRPACKGDPRKARPAHSGSSQRIEHTQGQGHLVVNTNNPAASSDS